MAIERVVQHWRIERREKEDLEQGKSQRSEDLRIQPKEFVL